MIREIKEEIKETSVFMDWKALHCKDVNFYPD